MIIEMKSHQKKVTLILGTLAAGCGRWSFYITEQIYE